MVKFKTISTCLKLSRDYLQRGQGREGLGAVWPQSRSPSPAGSGVPGSGHGGSGAVAGQGGALMLRARPGLTGGSAGAGSRLPAAQTVADTAARAAPRGHRCCRLPRVTQTPLRLQPISRSTIVDQQQNFYCFIHVVLFKALWHGLLENSE